MAFAITKTWTAEILTAADLNGAFTELETELNAFPTDGAMSSLSIGTSQIQANAVTIAKMADDSVDEDELVDGAVTENKVGVGAITNTKLGATCVTAAKVSTVFGTTTLNDAAAAALAMEEIYLASSDGILLVSKAFTAYNYTFLMDGSNPPTTSISAYGPTAASVQTWPVISGNYIKLTTSAPAASFTLRWFPIGGGTLTKQ